MVDLHHHLLPGLDDGSPDLQTSIAMARLAAADGITDLICTPHASNRYPPFRPETIAARLTELRSALATEAISVTLASGCDFHLSYDNIQDALTHPRKYTIAGGNYLLVELPDFGLSPSIGETLYELRLAGMTPILTHPERNPTLQRDPSRLADWLRAGLLIQVTAGSVLGEMGKPAQRMAEQLLAKRWVHFLATDAHNTTRRPPRMAVARDAVGKRHGAAYAHLLCEENPRAVLESRALPEQPEPQGLFDDEANGAIKPSFFRRLFTRR